MNAVPTETALLGGGCFWCLEAVFSRVEGVIAVEPGYAGGSLPNPTYEQVCGGQTGHAEVLRITFDTSIIAFAELLEVFFALHDPTTENRQGNDVGAQYRSVVFCRDGVQAATARNAIAQLTDARRFDAPVVTRVEGDATFWPAEPHHSNYYDHNPLQPYCMAVVAPKIDTLRRLFATRVKIRIC